MVKTNHTDYDLIVSLGGNCGVAFQTKHRGLRHCSLPLDWALMMDEKPIRMLPELIATRFEKFCQYENMVECGAAAKERGVIKCKLDDTYSGYRMLHSFAAPFADRGKYERCLSVLKRRIERMYSLSSSSRTVLFALTTIFAFDPALLGDIYSALSDAFPGVDVEIVNMQFGAGECRQFDILGGKIHVIRLEREWNHIYDTQLTSPDWRWLDRLQITSRPSANRLRKRNLKIKFLYKLWFTIGKYLERHNAGCANMRFDKWE